MSSLSEIILTFMDPKFRTAAYPQGVIHHLQSTGAHLSLYKLIKFFQGLQITRCTCTCWLFKPLRIFSDFLFVALFSYWKLHAQPVLKWAWVRG